MIQENTKEAVEELTLMLLYLNRFHEKGMDANLYRTWIGYDFDTLNILNDKGDIYSKRGTKSAYLDEKGCTRARKLLEKYGIKDWERQF